MNTQKNILINSVFFDIDKNSDQETNLPHMLPKLKDWEKIVSNLGIANKDKIIVYDNSDLIKLMQMLVYIYLFWA